ncbi:unnamed protein product, partial [Prorocentrum cordatum]
GSGCGASEDGCGGCGPLARWCELEEPAPQTFTTSHAPKRSGQAAVRLGAKDRVVAEVVGKPGGNGSASELQGKFSGALGAAAPQTAGVRGLARAQGAFLCLLGLALLALASLAWLRWRRRGAVGLDAGPPLSAMPMVQAEDSELEFA